MLTTSAFFFYNGGGDSQDTAYKVSQLGAGMAYPIVCVGIPKTVDFWLMRAGAGPAGDPQDPTEVDEVAWLSPAEAARSPLGV